MISTILPIVLPIVQNTSQIAYTFQGEACKRNAHYVEASVPKEAATPALNRKEAAISQVEDVRVGSAGYFPEI